MSNTYDKQNDHKILNTFHMQKGSSFRLSSLNKQLCFYLEIEANYYNIVKWL